MPTMLSKKSWLGVATEATPGTPIATPTVLVPSKASFKNKTKFVYADDDRGTRDTNNARVATVRVGEWSVKGNWYNDSDPYFLYAFMGADAATQPAVGTDPTVWQHPFTLGDIPPTLTLFRQLHTLTAYRAGYASVSKMQFKWDANAKLLECDSTLSAHYATKLANLVRPADTTVLPFAGYMPAITLFGSVSNDVSDMTIDLEQKIEEWYGSNGTQDYATLYYADRKATVSFTARFDATTLADDFDSVTEGALSVVLAGQVISHTYNESLTFTFPILGFDEVDIDTTKANIEVKVKGTARPGTAVNSLFTAMVQNTVASYAV